jgi:hypothetical protein
MQTVKEVTADSSFNMSRLLTASYMAGKIASLLSIKGFNNTPWPSFPTATKIHKISSPIR